MRKAVSSYADLDQLPNLPGSLFLYFKNEEKQQHPTHCTVILGRADADTTLGVGPSIVKGVSLLALIAICCVTRGQTKGPVVVTGSSACFLA